MNYDKKQMKITFYTSNYIYKLIQMEAEKKQLPKGRIATMLMDNCVSELENPFNYDLTLPDADETVVDAYADEGGKLISYMENIRTGMGLETLISLRHDMGVTSREVFLIVFSDCLRLGLIKAMLPPPRLDNKEYKEGYMYYKVTPQKGHETVKKKRNKANRYQKHVKSEKEFGDEA